MTNLVDSCCYETTLCYSDTEEIKDGICSMRNSLCEANRSFFKLDSARENVISRTNNMDTSCKDEAEDGDGQSFSQTLSLLLEEAERAYTECEKLKENLQTLKEELDETVWLVNGGIV